ncbi:MAG: hypothetical protein K6A77_05050 [Clostridiales bacterium]|nr:hypothetical protein [Clostridiales bacterium]
MKTFTLFLKRTLHMPLTWLLLVVLMVLSAISFGYSNVHHNLPCAVFAEDDSITSQHILNGMQTDEYLITDSREAFMNAIRRGKADCGIILKAGLDERMEAMDLTDCAEMWVSPRTSLERMYTLLVSSRIFNEFTPYLTIRAFHDYGYTISLSSVKEYFVKIREEITPLTFTITDIEGAPVTEAPGIDLPLSVIAIASWIAFGFYSIGILRRRTRSTALRFKHRQRIRFVQIPQTISIGLCLCLSVLLGILLGRFLLPFAVGRVLLKAVLYFMILTILFLLLMETPLSDHVLICIIALDASLSLVLCPLFWDITAYAPWLSYIRLISIPYWIFLL